MKDDFTDYLEEVMPQPEALSDYEIERDKPMPNFTHSVIQTNLAIFLGTHYGKQFRIATELTFDLPDRPATPDVAILEKRTVDFFSDTPREPNPPLVAIEIMSPSQGFSVFKSKSQRYFDFGVGSYWVIEPHLRTAYVFSGPRTFKTYINSDILRDETIGIEVPMDELFQ